MKKASLVITVFLLLANKGFPEDFNFPTVTNNVESIKAGFRAVIDNAKDLGSVEWGSSWTYSPESIARHYTEYLDNVLANMTYEKVRAYITSIRNNIGRIDRQSISRSSATEFDRYLESAYPNYDFEVTLMVNKYKGKPFPPAIALNYDKTRLENYDAQVKKNESDLAEFRSQLAALPTLDSLRSQLQIVQAELRKPELQQSTPENNQRRQQLRNEEAAIQKSLSDTFIARESLTQRIRSAETSLRNAENNRNRLATEIEEPARKSFIDSVFASLYNFNSWEAFFRNESSCIRDFFILNDVRTNLSSIVDEIPQRDAPAYRTKVNALLAGWGI